MDARDPAIRRQFLRNGGPLRPVALPGVATRRWFRSISLPGAGAERHSSCRKQIPLDLWGNRINPKAAVTDSPFSLMETHGEFARAPLAAGRLVLSRLLCGQSLIHPASPSVKFVLQGEEVYEIDGRTRSVRAGEFMLFDGATKASVAIRGSDTAVGLCIYLPSDHLGLCRLPDDRDLLPGSLMGCSDDPFASFLKEQASVLCKEPRAGFRLANGIIRKTSSESTQFLRRFANKLERLGVQRSTTRIEILHRLERARAFIHAHLYRTVRLEEIAHQASISRFHLTRLFAEVYGDPPLTYHRNLRLDASEGRLKRGEISPSQVADELGYSNPSAFTRAFVRRFGVPPSALSANGWRAGAGPQRPADFSAGRHCARTARRRSAACASAPSAPA
jgi:AraC-like DNA-binding protein